jgi:hypothetical protein
MSETTTTEHPVVTAMQSLAGHFDGVFVSHGNGVTEDVGGSIRATLTAAMTKGPTMDTETAHAALCDTTATIESVLAAHQPVARQDEGGYAIRQGCTCGWNSPRQVGAHRAHLAGQLIESVAPVEFARAQRVAALARLLVAEGHLTPQGKRLIDRALAEEES